jgi:hypothetical protein
MDAVGRVRVSLLRSMAAAAERGRRSSVATEPKSDMGDEPGKGLAMKRLLAQSDPSANSIALKPLIHLKITVNIASLLMINNIQLNI